ncbi:MAG: sensor histidine kinase [Ferruginibacter sp.]|nr:sensor histidine kinase [Chitinophagaceae bacterium]
MLKKLYHYIAGSDQSYGFEHRIYNLTSFVLVVFCIQGTLINYLLGLDMATVWLAMVGTVIAFMLFYISRVKGKFSPALIIVFSIAVIIILGTLHFYNGASAGPTIYLLIMVLNIFLLIASPRLQLFIYGLFGSTILGMLVLEYFSPQWVVPYTSSSQRLADHITVLVYSLFFTMIVIRLFRLSYDREKKILWQKKIELEEAYRETTKKNIHIESLIRELHHRVKNNLQVVSGLLSLQSNRLEDEKARQAMDEGRNRVDAMALIHQKLYMDDELAAVDINDYLENLSSSLATSFGYKASSVITMVQMVRTKMDIDKAIPIGLIVNELITNSYKHAFTEAKDPQIHIKLVETAAGLVLNISDNGAGLDNGETKSASFGMKLVHTLITQLDATMQVNVNNGTQYIITLKA